MCHYVVTAHSHCNATFFSIPKQVQSYLARFGYLQAPNPETGSLVTQDHYSEAIKQFQTFASLPTTGVLDDATKNMMNTPRCGVADINEGERPMANGRTHRRKRFVLQGSKWRVKDLTWSISQPTNQLSRNDVETQLARAWKVGLIILWYQRYKKVSHKN